MPVRGTAGKREDMDMYARVLAEAAGGAERVAPWVRFFIQCGSQDVKRYCEERGYLDVFRQVGATFLEPSCGACINAGPGVSKTREEVTISAINRNFPGRSGPGQLYLANPYTVAASRDHRVYHRVGARDGVGHRMSPAPPIVGESAEVRRLADLAKRIAPSSHPILLVGERQERQGSLCPKHSRRQQCCR